MASRKIIAAASLAAGLSLLSVSGNAAQANPFTTFGLGGGLIAHIQQAPR